MPTTEPRNGWHEHKALVLDALKQQRAMNAEIGSLIKTIMTDQARQDERHKALEVRMLMYVAGASTLVALSIWAVERLL